LKGGLKEAPTYLAPHQVCRWKMGELEFADP
jgi:hypothetical protein